MLLWSVEINDSMETCLKIQVNLSQKFMFHILRSKCYFVKLNHMLRTIFTICGCSFIFKQWYSDSIIISLYNRIHHQWQILPFLGMIQTAPVHKRDSQEMMLIEAALIWRRFLCNQSHATTGSAVNLTEAERKLTKPEMHFGFCVQTWCFSPIRFSANVTELKKPKNKIIHTLICTVINCYWLFDLFMIRITIALWQIINIISHTNHWEWFSKISNRFTYAAWNHVTVVGIFDFFKKRS